MFNTSIWLLILGCMFAVQMINAGESNEHIHIKLHVPQIIKKHTHTRTIFKHHFIKPKTPKSLSHPPILQSISASPSSLKLSNAASLVKLGDVDSMAAFGLHGKWRPSASEYRASELNYVPKKMKIPKKKNPFKVLEVMAEAHAEGHDLPSHVVKKLKPSLLDDDDSQTSEYIPDYMLANTNLFRHPDSDSDSGSKDSDSDSDSKADLIYVAPQHDKYKAKKSSFIPSKMVLPTFATFSKKKPKMSYDWVPGTISSLTSSAASLTSSDSADSDDSDFEPNFKHQLQQLMKRNKSRKPKRLSPTLSPSEDHINILQMTRKPISITNFTKYKNRLSAAAASNLNTSI